METAEEYRNVKVSVGTNAIFQLFYTYNLQKRNYRALRLEAIKTTAGS